MTIEQKIKKIEKFKNATCPSCANNKGILCGQGKKNQEEVIDVWDNN